MPRTITTLLQKIFNFTMLLGLGLFLGIFAVTSFPRLLLSTTDDMYDYIQIMEEPEDVLGASTEEPDSFYGCSSEKPIIGWIDFRGNKLIKNELPKGQTASACFVSIEKANKAGFR